MSKVQAQTKSVKDLLGVKYGIDVFQREYDWGQRQVEDLLSDFENKFLEEYDKSHDTTAVVHYPHYFLGTIITVAKNEKRYIVDGQQRLTTLTLLLIYINHLRNEAEGIYDVSPLIFSDNFGEMSFNIDIPERLACMEALFQSGEFDATDHTNLSVRNLTARYDELDEIFPETLHGHALRLFVYWLIEKVNIVEIVAPTDDNAFTIFETMNDRGMNLSQADMLKGYLLANINSSQKKTQANDEWRRLTKELVDVDEGVQEDFFKNWLRAKYADETRERKKGAENKDFENIEKFHRWTRDNRKRIRLEKSDNYYDFITRNFTFYAKYFIAMRQAAQHLTSGREEIYYNAYNNFTLQYMLALAPLKLADDSETAWKKIRLVTTFADIYLARRMVNFRRNGYSTLQYTMFNFAKDIRDSDLEELREKLMQSLTHMRWDNTFAGVIGEYPHWRPPTFSLNNFTGRSIRYLLARMTAWVGRECGEPVNFLSYLWDAKGKPYDIEHIWASNHEYHKADFSSEDDFHRHRNYFGGLLLLPRPINRSLKDKPYEYKLEKYREQNLLTASLNDARHKNSPSFKQFIQRTNLPFKPHSEFKRDDLMERQHLYRQICERIWSPERLDAI